MKRLIELLGVVADRTSSAGQPSPRGKSQLRSNLSKSVRVMIGAVTAVAVCSVVFPVIASAAQTGVAPTDPGHSISANASGDYATVAIKADGQLFIRRDLNGNLSDWKSLGNGSWVSADVTVDPNGAAHVVAIKSDGTLFTNRWNTTGGWTGWVNHEALWSDKTMPSIASNSSTTVLAALSTDGRLVTKTYSSSSWSRPTFHGSTGWAHVDADIADDGDIWFAGVKADGRLYVRKHLGTKWSGFAPQGLPTWATDTAPSIAARSNGVVFGAVKEDGRLYTRAQNNGKWEGFVRLGRATWASVDVATTENGTVILGGIKTFGRMYTRTQAATGVWSGWSWHGRDTWSTIADPSVAFGAGTNGMLVGVKQGGTLYQRTGAPGSWSAWTSLGAGDWAAGSGGIAPPVVPTPKTSATPTPPPASSPPASSPTPTPPPASQPPASQPPAGPPPPAPGPRDDLTLAFSEDFSEESSLDRFDWQLHTGGANRGTPDTWLGDHDESCAGPGTTRVIHKPGNDITDVGETAYWCAPKGPSSGHLMTSMRTGGYEHVDFSPAQSFQSVSRVCWAQNMNKLGRKWIQLAVVSEASFQADDGRLDYVKRSLEPTAGDGGVFLSGDDFLFIYGGGFPKIEVGRNGDDSSTRGFTTLDKARRHVVCLEDLENGTIRVEMERESTVEVQILEGAMPEGPVRVIFQDVTYNATKNPSPLPNPFTWHWDDITIETR